MRLLSALSLASVFASGCATQGISSSSYTPGTKASIANEITVSQQYSAVWDALVRDLAKSFYVINNIDKESRIINVSFSSQKADEYVDCGRTQRTFKEGDVSESFNYAVAARSTYKVAASRQEHPSFSNYFAVTREPVLEGRANIYVAPSSSDPGRTTISVNTRYILTVKLRSDGFSKHVSGNGARQASCRLFLLADHQMDLLLDQDLAHRSIVGARARRGQLGCPQGKPADSRLRRYPS